MFKWSAIPVRSKCSTRDSSNPALGACPVEGIFPDPVAQSQSPRKRIVRGGIGTRFDARKEKRRGLELLTVYVDTASIRTHNLSASLPPFSRASSCSLLLRCASADFGDAPPGRRWYRLRRNMRLSNTNQHLRDYLLDIALAGLVLYSVFGLVYRFVR